MCHLARCVQELRWAMKSFTTFSDHAVLEKAKSDQGLPKAKVEGPTQPSTTLTKQLPVLDTRPSMPSAMPANELTFPTFLPAMLTDEPVIPTVPPVTAKNQKGTKNHEYPNWTEIHPFQQVTPLGHVPLSFGNLRQCCHSHSSSRRRA